MKILLFAIFTNNFELTELIFRNPNYIFPFNGFYIQNTIHKLKENVRFVDCGDSMKTIIIDKQCVIYYSKEFYFGLTKLLTRDGQKS